MRLEPLSIINLTQLLTAIANHIDNIVCQESFTTITTDNRFEILFAPDACEDLGYTPIFWDTENCLGMIQSEPLLNEIVKINKIKEAATILDRCKNLDYAVDEGDDHISICITTAEDYIVCFITVYPENVNDFYVSFNLRLDPISVVDLAILMHKISSYITMGFIVEKAFVSGVKDKGVLLFFDDAYLDLDYIPLVWNTDNCLDKVF